MPCSQQKAGHFGRLDTLVVEDDGGGVGGHEDADETGDGDVVKFLCLKNSCSSHSLCNSAESIMIIDISSWERERSGADS